MHTLVDFILLLLFCDWFCLLCCRFTFGLITAQWCLRSIIVDLTKTASHFNSLLAVHYRHKRCSYTHRYIYTHNIYRIGWIIQDNILCLTIIKGIALGDCIVSLKYNIYIYRLLVFLCIFVSKLSAFALCIYMYMIYTLYELN